MPWTPVPGGRGVQQRPASETLADPDYEIVRMPDGTIRAGKKPGAFTKALPYVVGGMIGGPHLASLLGVGAGSAALPTSIEGATALTSVPAGTVGASTGASMANPGFFPTLSRFFGSPGGATITDTVGQLIGAGMQTRAAGQASEAQDRYLREALEFEKARDARDYADYIRERDRGWGREDARDARLAPLRKGGGAAYNTLSSLILGDHSPVNTGVRLPDRRLSGLLRS